MILGSTLQAMENQENSQQWQQEIINLWPQFLTNTKVDRDFYVTKCGKEFSINVTNSHSGEDSSGADCWIRRADGSIEDRLFEDYSPRGRIGFKSCQEIINFINSVLRPEVLQGEYSEDDFDAFTQDREEWSENELSGTEDEPENDYFE